MELSLAKNIAQLRKLKNLTQEACAEKLGVTFAAVSKWERGIAIPELNTIIKMANLFEVSLDYLVGFDLQKDSIEKIQKNLDLYQKSKNYLQAINVAQKALLLYPNDFGIVYACGKIYYFAGIEENNRTYKIKSLQLLHRAIDLFSQNHDSNISHAGIQHEIANLYLSLGNINTALSILQKYNVDGVYSPEIALIFTTKLANFDPEDAKIYLQDAFIRVISTTLHTLLAYANYFEKTQKYTDCLEVVLWLTAYINSLKKPAEHADYLDKILALLYKESAFIHFKLGEKDKVYLNLREAYKLAKKFDAEASYKISNIKFYLGDMGELTGFDNLGKSILASICESITEFSNLNQADSALSDVWQQIVAAEKEENNAKS